MNDDNEIIKYFSLDEAREEIKKRWNNVELKNLIKKELGNHFINYFDCDKPRSVLFRQLISPDNGFHFFYYCSKYINVQPTIFEFLDDMFVSVNEEKKAYGRLFLDNHFIDIMNFHLNEKYLIKDLITLKGENVVDFHHNLIKETKINIDIYDMSKWFKNIGTAKDYYYYFLLHFLVFGVLFESFVSDEKDNNESSFTRDVVSPSLKKIYNKFNLRPIIVRMYPEGQIKEEDLYWWSYPSYIDGKAIKYLLEKKYIN